MKNKHILMVSDIFSKINWDMISSLYKMEHIEKYIDDLDFDNSSIIDKLKNDLIFTINKAIDEKSSIMQYENWLVIFVNIDNEIETLDERNDESDNSRLIVYYTVSQVYSDSSKIDYNKKINDVDDSIIKGNKDDLNFNENNKDEENDLSVLFYLIMSLAENNKDLKRNNINENKTKNYKNTKKYTNKPKKTTENIYSNLEKKSISDLENLLKISIEKEEYEMSAKIHELILQKNNNKDNPQI